MMLSRATYKSSNKRENGVLVDSENQEYRFNKCSGRKNYYICRKKAQFGCRATAMVETVDINKCIVSQNHNHGTDLQAAKVETIIKNELHHSSHYQEVPVRNLVARIVSTASASNIAASHLPTTNAMKSRIHRARRRNNPRLPKVVKYSRMG